jgi:hypothetical protein
VLDRPAEAHFYTSWGERYSAFLYIGSKPRSFSIKKIMILDGYKIKKTQKIDRIWGESAIFQAVSGKGLPPG